MVNIYGFQPVHTKNDEFLKVSVLTCRVLFRVVVVFFYRFNMDDRKKAYKKYACFKENTEWYGQGLDDSKH